MLEEPPPNSLFLLVSHAPGRLLPTIRSRCRRLDFQALDDDAMTSILERRAPALNARGAASALSRWLAARRAARWPSPSSTSPSSRRRRWRSFARATRPTPAAPSWRSELGKKAAADRYAAFLDLAPSLIAREARRLDGAPRERALDAYAKARELAAIAPRLSLDPAATVFQLGGILAEVALGPSLKR